MEPSGVRLASENSAGWKWKMGLIQVWKQAANSQQASNTVHDAVWELI